MAVEQFQQRGVEYDLEIQNGAADILIPIKAAQRDFITVVGQLGRPQIRRWLYGRSIHRLIEEIARPIIYVPEACLPLRNALVCIGGLGYEVTAESLGIRLAGLSQAHVTLLHVIPPMDLNYPSARNEQKGGKHLAETDTLPGRALRRG
jgi:hypothetical protein